MIQTKEHYELIAQFDLQFKSRRLDKEEDKSLWAKGFVYQDGQVNDLFLVFRQGYSFGRFTERMESA